MVGVGLIVACLMLGGVLGRFCGLWYPIVSDFHRLFIAISRAVVNDDGKGGTIHPMVWSAGSVVKKRRDGAAARDRALLPDPMGIWEAGWICGMLALLCRFRSSSLPFWIPFTGRLVGVTWEVVAFRILSCSFCMSSGLESGLYSKRPW